MRWMIALGLASTLAVGCGGEKAAGGAPAAEAIGVQACDDYIAKMNACMPKLSASEKTSVESGFKDTREAWKRAAAKGGVEKEQLEPQCKAALVSLPPTCK